MRAAGTAGKGHQSIRGGAKIVRLNHLVVTGRHSSDALIRDICLQEFLTGIRVGDFR